MPDEQLPANVIASIRGGNTIEAIKQLRESSGIGLKEAKEAVDRYRPGTPAGESAMARTGNFPDDVIDALRRRRKIEAIRLLRERTGQGLKDAKEAIETYEKEHAAELTPYSSGEVPRTGDRLWLIVLVVAIVLIAYYFLTRSA